MRQEWVIKFRENLEFGGIASFSLLDSDLSLDYSLHIGTYANYYFAKNFYATAQFQDILLLKNLKEQKIGQEEMKLHYILGGGYMTKVGNNFYIQIGAMYKRFLEENSSIFSSGFRSYMLELFLGCKE